MDCELCPARCYYGCANSVIVTLSEVAIKSWRREGGNGLRAIEKKGGKKEEMEAVRQAEGRMDGGKHREEFL